MSDLPYQRGILGNSEHAARWIDNNHALQDMSLVERPLSWPDEQEELRT